MNKLLCIFSILFLCIKNKAIKEISSLNFKLIYNLLDIMIGFCFENGKVCIGNTLSWGVKIWKKDLHRLLSFSE
jgi:hypothetical protein